MFKRRKDNVRKPGADEDLTEKVTIPTIDDLRNVKIVDNMGPNESLYLEGLVLGRDLVAALHNVNLEERLFYEHGARRCNEAIKRCLKLNGDLEILDGIYDKNRNPTTKVAQRYEQFSNFFFIKCGKQKWIDDINKLPADCNHMQIGCKNQFADGCGLIYERKYQYTNTESRYRCFQVAKAYRETCWDSQNDCLDIDGHNRMADLLIQERVGYAEVLIKCGIPQSQISYKLPSELNIDFSELYEEFGEQFLIHNTAVCIDRVYERYCNRLDFVFAVELGSKPYTESEWKVVQNTDRYVLILFMHYYIIYYSTYLLVNIHEYSKIDLANSKKFNQNQIKFIQLNLLSIKDIQLYGPDVLICMIKECIHLEKILKHMPWVQK